MPKRFFLLLVLLQAGAVLGQMNMPMADSGDPVPPEQLPTPQHIEGVGNVRFPITANAKAQKWFEQGYNIVDGCGTHRQPRNDIKKRFTQWLGF